MDLFSAFVTFTMVIEFGFSQYTSPAFHETYSDECLQVGITSETDCPLSSGKSRWSREQNTPESGRRFKSTSSNKNGVSRRCFSRLLVQTKTCNSRPNCKVTTYKYILPKRDGAGSSSYCEKDWSFESKCMDDGPGGKNTKSVYFNCFKKKSRSYCGVDFETCESGKCFKWTGFRRQCFTECKTSKFTGVAMQFKRSCRKCDGGQVSASLCPGGEKGSTKLGRCIERSRAKAKAPDCIIDTTSVPTTSSTTTKTTSVSTTSSTTTKTTSVPTTSSTTTTELTTTPAPATTIVSKPTTATTNAPTTTTKTNSKTTRVTTQKNTTAKESVAVSYVTTKPILKRTENPISSINQKYTTTQGSTFSKETTQVEITTKPIQDKNQRILAVGIPDFEFTSPRNVPISTTANDSLGGVPDLQKQNDSFQLITIAGGAGAGVVFIILIMIIVILLVKRKTPKRVPAPVLTTSATGRPSSPGNPVVDSSSFRIATWIRERPSLRNMSRASESSTSVVSDAEYWRVGRSSDEKTPSPTQPSISEDFVVAKHKPLERYDDHIYDEVSFGVVEDNMGTFVQVDRRLPRKGRHTSINSVQSEPTTSTVNFPNNENAIYAVVNKSRKKTPINKKSSDTTSSGSRKEVASEHVASITRLNGRHLREGVLQIEFDEKEGVRCKLSDSDVYMNLEETEPPQVI